jgi:hypothetical protein
VEEPARLDLGVLRAVRAEVEARAASHDVPENIPIAVVMPARDGAGLGSRAHERRTSRFESDLAQDPRRRRAGRQPVGGHCGDSFAFGHAAG